MHTRHGRLTTPGARIRLLGFLVIGLVAAGPLTPCAAATQVASPDALSPERSLDDFDALWAYVRDHYAYFHRKQTDWERVRAHYRPRAARVESRREPRPERRPEDE